MTISCKPQLDLRFVVENVALGHGHWALLIILMSTDFDEVHTFVRHIYEACGYFFVITIWEFRWMELLIDTLLTIAIL